MQNGVWLSENLWCLWLLLLIGSLVLEGVSLQLFSVWFAVGALVAMLASFLGVPIEAQVLLFVGVTAVAVAATRPVVKRLQGQKVATNADRYLGKRGVVVQEVDNNKGTGRVRVEGLEWAARSADDAVLPPQTEVATVGLQGVKLLVQASQPEPAARNGDHSPSQA